MNRGFGIGVPAMGPGAGFGANNGRVMQSRRLPAFAPVPDQAFATDPTLLKREEAMRAEMALRQQQALAQQASQEKMAPMHAQAGPIPPQASASPIRAPKDKAMGFLGKFGRILAGGAYGGENMGWIERLGRGPEGMNAVRDEIRAGKKTAEQEARRQQMLGQLGLSQEEMAYVQLFPDQAGEIIGQRYKPAAPIKGEAINDRLVNPYTGKEMGNFSDPTLPEYSYEQIGDEIVAVDKRDPNNRISMGKAPVKSPLVSVTTGDGSPGSRPIIGDPPKDYQARYNEQTGSYEFEPIPGSDAAREREGAAIKAGTTIRLADEQFELMSTSIDKAIEQADFWSAGLMAQATSGIGSTPARNLRATIDTIVANIGFEKLQEMRETSPTGGALGNVTERELTFLQSVRGSLDQIQDPAQLREVLAQVKQSLSIIHEIRKMNMQSNMSNSGTRIPDGNAMGADAPPLVWNSKKGDFE
jgi:hypothetical protein